MSALLVDNPGKYATLSAENIGFGDRKQTPVYQASIGFPLDVTSVSSKLYIRHEGIPLKKICFNL